MTPKSAVDLACEHAGVKHIGKTKSGDDMYDITHAKFMDHRAAIRDFLAGHAAGLSAAGELADALENVKRFAYIIPGKTADDIWIQCRDALEKYKAARGE